MFAARLVFSWVLLAAIGAALLTRALVSEVADLGPGGLALWLTHNLAAAAIGVGVWWRGTALSVAELTPGEIRTEFGVIAVCMLAVLALVRPFVLADQVLLAVAVGLFGAGGLLASPRGRGVLIFDASRFFRIDQILVGIGTIGILWVIMDNVLLTPLERHTVKRWGTVVEP